MVEMKAARYDRYGPPEVLYESTIPVPRPKSGEVLVRVHAASLNGIDLIVRAGTLRCSQAANSLAVPAMTSSAKSRRRLKVQAGCESVIAFGE